MGLKLEGHDFPLGARVPPGLVMKLSAAEQDKDYSKAMSLLLRLAGRLVADDAKDDFEKFVASEEFDDIDYDEFSTAVASAMSEVAGRPTEKSASSSPGEGETQASSRDVSSSQDIPRLAPSTSYLFGRSAAS